MAHSSESFMRNGLEGGLTVDTLYQTVIDDVVNGVREAFLDDGIDEKVLQELRTLWDLRLGNGSENDDDEEEARGRHNLSNSSSVFDQSSSSLDTSSLGPLDPDELVPVQVTLPALSDDPVGLTRSITIHVPVYSIHTNKLQEVMSISKVQATLLLPSTEAAMKLQKEVDKLLIRKTNPQKKGNSVVTKQAKSKKGLEKNSEIVITKMSTSTKSSKNGSLLKKAPPSKKASSLKKVPSPKKASSSKKASPLKKVPSSKKVSPSNKASSLKKTPSSKKVSSSTASKSKSKLSPTRSTRCTRKMQLMTSLDGAADLDDSSEEESDDDFIDVVVDLEVSDDTEAPEDNTNELQGNEDEAESSNVDVVDDVVPARNDDPRKTVEPGNMIVCQYDKIQRTRNKWKFQLKDGIMHLEGKDYIFQKANGDAEW